ncbi:hypothetical protein [Propionivibrio sp.]|uniref:hypothetical protein n=1 Tax=Propionivibrio sp. TaxID=2212460 RepID=UPI0025E9CD35|nr:hypothetical protein [Propionivibrio sp.]
MRPDHGEIISAYLAPAPALAQRIRAGQGEDTRGCGFLSGRPAPGELLERLDGDIAG